MASSTGSSASASRAASRGAGSCAWSPAGPAAACARSSASTCLEFGLSLSVQPTANRRPPMMKNGIFGRPGTRPKTSTIAPAISGALRWSRICVETVVPRLFSCPRSA